jgi:hypothetical protein
MIRLVYRAIPILLILLFLYMGSGWARDTFFQVKERVLLESAKWEMNSLRSQFEFCLKFRAGDLASYDIFLERSYKEKDREGFRTDPWGTEYWYGFVDGVYHLQSAGPDCTFQTEDDLIVTNYKYK